MGKKERKKEQKKAKALKKAARALKSDGSKFKKINDRISYILVKTGKRRDDLESYIGIDLDDYHEGYRSTAAILKDCADFLGVSVYWLISGDGDPFPENASSISNNGTISGSALLHGNTAGSIVVNAGAGEVLTEHERELLRIYRSLDIKQQIMMLKFGHDVENGVIV